MDTAQLDVSMKEVGIYHARFRPTLRKFLNQDFIEILLVNVFEALSGHPRSEHFKLSVENAKRDLEWLLLPQTPIIFDNGLVEYSAILDGGCLSEVRKYRLL